MPHNEYKTEEDPKLFQSTKTQRGPLSDNWIEEYKKQVFPIMCAYKLCKVEFRYWGMQSKIERFIHDTGEHTPCWVGSGRATQPLCLLSPACLPPLSACLPGSLHFCCSGKVTPKPMSSFPTTPQPRVILGIHEYLRARAETSSMCYWMKKP